LHYCIDIRTFNVKIMLNMPRINIDKRVGAKSIIEFGLSHRDVAHVVFTPQITDNGKDIHIQKGELTYLKINL